MRGCVWQRHRLSHAERNQSGLGSFAAGPPAREVPWGPQSGAQVLSQAAARPQGRLWSPSPRCCGETWAASQSGTRQPGRAPRDPKWRKERRPAPHPAPRTPVPPREPRAPHPRVLPGGRAPIPAHSPLVSRQRSVRTEEGWGAVKKRCRWEPGHPQEERAEGPADAPHRRARGARPYLPVRLRPRRGRRPRTPRPERAQQVSGGLTAHLGRRNCIQKPEQTAEEGPMQGDVDGGMAS
uniref:Uncharacterized protein n=1 Tax=Rangifer tarandus platyrhynchus TaxID=3082113 RepID=A0ACB0FGT2_RANTA|nr:unnamed protein product [Rangifer tarandus platyrhynchus]